MFVDNQRSNERTNTTCVQPGMLIRTPPGIEPATTLK